MFGVVGLAWIQGKRKEAIFFGIFLLLLFLLFYSHTKKENLIMKNTYSNYQEYDEVRLVGVIAEKNQKDFGLEVRLKQVRDKKGRKLHDVLLYDVSDPCELGETIEVSGTVSYFPVATNEGQFDVRRYRHSLNIDISLTECKVLGRNYEKSFLHTFLETKKEMGCRKLCKYFKEDSAGVLEAMIFGEKSDLQSSVRENYQMAGISHILAISGLHVSIIGMSVFQFLKRRGLPYWLSGLLAGMGLILYSLLVGAGVSTMRALFMFLLTMLAMILGRGSDPMNSLGIVVCVLLWKNPYYLYNQSFLLSVSSIVGITGIGPLLRWKKREDASKFENWICTSLGLWFGTLPVNAYYFYQLSMYGPLVNLVVLALLPVLVYACIFGLLFCPLLFYPCEWILWFFEKICLAVGKLPLANFVIGKPSFLRVVIYLLVLYLAMKYCDYNRYKKKKLVWVIILLVVWFCPMPRREEICFLDVGQGDGIYIETKDGYHLFVDGGSSNKSKIGENILVPFLKAKGVRRIDYWFISHCDLDHISGISVAMEEGRVKCIVFDENVCKNEGYENLIQTAKNTKTKIAFLSDRDGFGTKSWRIQNLSCKASNNEINDASFVLLYETRRTKALFAGDISSKKEEEIINQYASIIKNLTLLKANHHGSNGSNSKAFLEVTKPKVIVISCAKKNSYHHPGKEAVRRMEEVSAEIFYTMNSGQITIKGYNQIYENN